MPRELKQLGPGFEPTLPEPNVLDYWVERALARQPERPHRAAATSTSRRSRSTARAPAHLPTLDLVGEREPQPRHGDCGRRRRQLAAARSAQIGLAFNVPIYQGGFVNSRVREAIALQESARQDLEVAARATPWRTRRSASRA